MVSSPFLRAVALTLALVLPATGCAIRAPTWTEQALERRAGSFTECLSRDADPGRLALGPFTDEADGLEMVRHRHHGGVRAAIIAGVVVIFLFVVIADLMILPYTARRHRHFCCTVTVISWCR